MQNILWLIQDTEKNIYILTPLEHNGTTLGHDGMVFDVTLKGVSL